MNQIYDQYFMKRAFELAERGRGFVEPNPMVGCVIIRPDFLDSPDQFGNKNMLPNIVGRGFHQCFGGNHAEIEALNSAGENARGGTLYVNLEPCCHFGKTPPCVPAIIKAGIRRVVIGMADPFAKVNGQGISELKAAGIEVDCDVLEEEAQSLNMPYITRLSKKRPWIVGKWAMTLDGKIASRTGSSYWISSEASRQKVHELRSYMDGIMIGSRTAMEDDPKLTVRLPEGEVPRRIPKRIVFDSGGTLSVFSELALSVKEVPLLLVFGPDTPKEKALFWEKKGAEVLVLNVPTHEQRLILLMEKLAERGITNLLVEGGGILLGHLFDLEYLDEVYVFIAPKIIGGKEAVVPVAGLGFEHMKNAIPILSRHVETIGSDIMISGRLDYKK
ncbi:MAG: bifunctional diaminohydroxyphosphoribosylaminopyrimidine deaminase/5-amino-6-(5-phosphoribosylamino)uracil reductase RibD [Planctomycetia bacterium]|nr:bifunctional diaminohydroxyphosphoribosylaminopyrimidine deaminase/5-amino-6-(5-phosphoribosylamino)uracil reductase RibD [Planctomycetia bacterium]